MHTINCMDLTKPNYAYRYGFIQADGHMSQSTRNRGRVSIEIKKSDRGILEQFQQLVPYNSTISERTRTTNFASGSESAIWTVCNIDFRNTLSNLGLPTGRKSDIVAPPTVPFSEPDYFRGWVDANGSVGYTAQEFPFLSLTIASDAIAHAYIQFLGTVTGKEKHVARNARDHVFNIVVYKLIVRANLKRVRRLEGHWHRRHVSERLGTVVIVNKRP